MSNVKDFLKRKDIVITPQRYLIEALGAMAQGLFASLLIGTIIKTLGQQTGLETLVDLGGYATAMSGPAMAVAIGWALHCPPLVLFSLVTVGYSSNALGGAGGPLAPPSAQPQARWAPSSCGPPNKLPSSWASSSRSSWASP